MTINILYSDLDREPRHIREAIRIMGIKRGHLGGHLDPNLFKALTNPEGDNRLELETARPPS